MKELGRGSGFLMANEAKQKGELMNDVHISSLFVCLFGSVAGVRLHYRSSFSPNRHGCLHLGTSF